MFTLSSNIFATVDVFGTSKLNGQKIIKKYEKDIVEIEEGVNQLLMKNKVMEKNKEEALLIKRQDLLTKIKQEYGFLYVGFESVQYPDLHKTFTTIEVVSPKEAYRMNYVDPVIKQRSDPHKNIKARRDVIDKMMAYQELGMRIMLDPKHSYTTTNCPVYHCTWGFDEPKLKPYLKLFNTSATKDRKLILDTLQENDIERRGAAIFLVGHFKNPHEIIQLLSPYVKDKQSLIRNNAMRVIGATLLKSKITDINIEPFLAALDSPYETDRNKSLFILWNLANVKNVQNAIIKQSGDRLIKLLQLKQPNNHDIAFLLLKKISGKNYGENKVAAWQKWLTMQQHKLA